MSRLSKAYEDRIYFSMKVIGSEMKVTEFVFKFNLVFMAVIFAMISLNNTQDFVGADYYPIVVTLLKWVFILFGVSLLTSSVSFYILNKILQNAFIILASTTVDMKLAGDNEMTDGQVEQIADSQQLLDKNVHAAQLASNITLSLFCTALLLFVLSSFFVLFRM